MTDTRYAAPIASVSDVPPDTLPTRPTQVTLALWLLIGNFALGLGSVGEDYGRSPVEASVSLVMGIAVSAFLLSKLAKGRNWARILVVAFVAISWLVLIVAVSQGRPLTLMAYVRATLQTICIALLCLGSGAAWFREVRTSGRR